MSNAARRFLAGLAVPYNADQAVTRERATVRLWMAETTMEALRAAAKGANELGCVF